MLTHSEYFVKIVLLVEGKLENLDVANDSYYALDEFIKALQTEEGVAMYLDSLDFVAEMHSFEDLIYRRDTVETLIARVSYLKN